MYYTWSGDSAGWQSPGSGANSIIVRQVRQEPDLHGLRPRCRYSSKSSVQLLEALERDKIFRFCFQKVPDDARMWLRWLHWNSHMYRESHGDLWRDVGGRRDVNLYRYPVVGNKRIDQRTISGLLVWCPKNG